MFAVDETPSPPHRPLMCMRVAFPSPSSPDVYVRRCAVADWDAPRRRGSPGAPLVAGITKRIQSGLGRRPSPFRRETGVVVHRWGGYQAPVSNLARSGGRSGPSHEAGSVHHHTDRSDVVDQGPRDDPGEAGRGKGDRGNVPDRRNDQVLPDGV